MIDLHIHILPGFDDGAASLAESLYMAALAAGEGINVAVATPHVISGLYDHSPPQIQTAVDLLNCHLTEKGLPLRILPGAEYRLEPTLPQRLSAGQLMTINAAGRYLLVELPPSLVPDYTEELLYEIQLQGVTPILAHPERNPELNRSAALAAKGRLYRLVQRGVLVQITAGSITGRFGPPARRAALQMLDTGLAQVVATDAHSARAATPVRRGGRTPASFTAAFREVESRYGPALAGAVFSAQPRRIIAGEVVEPVLREAPAPGFLGRVFRTFSRQGIFL